MFEWLAAQKEGGYVSGTLSDPPQFRNKTPDIVYFRGNGTCELVDFQRMEGVEVEVTRGTWIYSNGTLEMVLLTEETYGEGTKEDFTPPITEIFEISDWQAVCFKVHEPSPRLFDGIATELKREYLVGVWSDVPFVAEGGTKTVLTLEDDGTYELVYYGSNELVTTGESIESRLGTWEIVGNKLELTQTSQIKTWGGKIKTDSEGGLYVRDQESRTEELDPPVIDAYEIMDLQYVIEIPKETNWQLDIATQTAGFLQCDGLMFLGEQLTMHIGETQFWN
jgi:hypothetical protein